MTIYCGVCGAVGDHILLQQTTNDWSHRHTAFWSVCFALVWVRQYDIPVNTKGYSMNLLGIENCCIQQFNCLPYLWFLCVCVGVHIRKQG